MIARAKKFLTLFITACVMMLSFAGSITNASATISQDTSAIASSNGFTCALRASNEIYCVGLNDKGQLGDGTTDNSSEPVAVGLLGSKSITLGASHGCAIGPDSYGYCWGDNSKGQLSSNVSGSTIRKISLPNRLVSIHSGGNYSCAISDTEYKLYCWGDLGPGSPAKYNNSAATLITEFPSVSYVDVSSTGVCVVATAGVSCWGSLVSSETPKLISGTQGATSVTVGQDFACAMVGEVKCFGDNSQGQLGNGSTSQTSETVTVTGLSDVTQVEAGDRFACSLSVSGDTFCWGDNSKSQITAGVNDQSTRVPTLITRASQISAGNGFFCALLKDASIKCLGDNTYAQSAVLSSSTLPLIAKQNTEFKKVSSGLNTTCVLTKTSKVQCWGVILPEFDPSLTFSDIAVGNASACAIKADQLTVYCWGANGSGQLGDNTMKATVVPTVVQGLGNSSISHISAGYRHFCVNTVSGLVYCWGDNSKGQLGSNTGTDSKTAVAVPGIGTAKGIASGNYHNCALLTSNAIYCWGDNSKRQISASVSNILGVTDPGFTNISKVSLGGDNSCFLQGDGKLNCIGDNTESQAVGLINGPFSDVSVGIKTTCVTKSADTQISCFGSNSNNKLGRAGLKSSTPVDISTLKASFTTGGALSVGSENVCVITTINPTFSSGVLACWGLNTNGQLASSSGFPSAYTTPSITISGSNNVGETLSATVTTSESTATQTFTWLRATAPAGTYATLGNSNSASIVLASSDEKRYFKVILVLSKWGTESGVYSSATSNQVLGPIRLLITPVPTISGTFKVGGTLMARPGRWDTGVKFTYQWYRGSTLIKGATSASYRLVAADAGKQITLAVTGTKIGLPKVIKKSAKSVKVAR
jgi:alpha-tubulin suppressor-like RCC1 family protein